MGAINLMMEAAVDAINELGADIDAINEGYHFKADPDTRSVDDITIRAGDNEFVLAIVWKNLEGYHPSCPNLGHAIRNSGDIVVPKKDYDFLVEANEDLKQSLDWANEREADDARDMRKMRSTIKLLTDCLQATIADKANTVRNMRALDQAKEFLD